MSYDKFASGAIQLAYIFYCTSRVSNLRLRNVQWHDELRIEGLGRNWLWPSRRTIPAFNWQTEDPRNPHFSVANASDTIQTRHVLTTNLNSDGYQPIRSKFNMNRVSLYPG